jgi:triphosphoribosyl-dephospho-CoA synthase
MLEVSIQKPGNVSFSASFKETRVEHFLASAIASGPSLHRAATRGIAVTKKQIAPQKLGMGNLIKTCIADIAAWQHGGNTILGTVMLFVPLAVAAGMTAIEKNGGFDFSILRQNLDLAIRATTAKDAVQLYEAIEIACPSGLGDVSELDVTDLTSKKKLLKRQISLLEVCNLASSYDDICHEWANNYPITFDLAYPYLWKQLNSKPLNVAVVHTFLYVLSNHPDTFIARKMGNTKAQEISKEAKNIIALGGLETPTGKESIYAFDKKLRLKENTCNPGTTADLTATALALCVLGGYRP